MANFTTTKELLLDKFPWSSDRLFLFHFFTSPTRPHPRVRALLFTDDSELRPSPSPSAGLATLAHTTTPPSLPLLSGGWRNSISILLILMTKCIILILQIHHRAAFLHSIACLSEEEEDWDSSWRAVLVGNGRKTRFIGAVGPSAEIMPLPFFIHSLLCDHHPPRPWMDDLSSSLLVYRWG